jgi:hypothetical protein
VMSIIVVHIRRRNTYIARKWKRKRRHAIKGGCYCCCCLFQYTDAATHIYMHLE